MRQRLLLTPGEPAGIGPDLTVIMAAKSWPLELVAIADPALLIERAQLLNLPLKVIETDLATEAMPNRPNELKVFPIKLLEKVIPGKLVSKNALYVIETLKTAVNLCLNKKANGVVTGPVHKEIINTAGIHFSGHTEFFAQESQVDHTVMLFVVQDQQNKFDLKVALVTTHLPLLSVPGAITSNRLKTTITILHDWLKNTYRLSNPIISVCGLNPHAGENGYLGREEIDLISPTLASLRAEGMTLIGPLPADTAFTPANLEKTDAVVAMYHDQALPLIKHIGFSNAVNVTLGLPFIRTSVDHGTALDLAGSHLIDSGSMHTAIKLAIKLCETTI